MFITKNVCLKHMILYIHMYCQKQHLVCQTPNPAKPFGPQQSDLAAAQLATSRNADTHAAARTKRAETCGQTRADAVTQGFTRLTGLALRLR